VRILFTTYPAHGHLHPLVPLALAAQCAGHDVRLATGPNLVGWAAQCGLDSRPVGLSQDAAAEVADRDFAGPARTGHMFTDVWVPGALADLLELSSSWRPELVVHEEQEYAGVLLAGMLDVPCVTQSWSAPARPAAGREFESRALEPIWHRHGLGSTSRRVGQLYLDACPPQFQTADLADIGRTTRVVKVRPGQFDGPPAEPPALLADLGRPGAYVTLGTVSVFSTPRLLGRIASALAPLFASVVVTTGPNSVDSLGDLPPNVYPIDYVPQSLVLPAVDVVVSHGGAGGTVGAIMHGLPHLVLPGDGQSQITTAEAVHRVGAGLRLRDDERDDAHIADAARRLITEPSFAVTARRLKERLDDLPGPIEVLALIESLGGGRSLDLALDITRADVARAADFEGLQRH
jgi:UDP:flavonoid glycosyltransferase YjiC (YdhE family)